MLTRIISSLSKHSMGRYKLSMINARIVYKFTDKGQEISNKNGERSGKPQISNRGGEGREKGAYFPKSYQTQGYKRDHFKRHQQNKDQNKDRNQNIKREVVLSKGPDGEVGYGHYDWRDQNSYAQAIIDRYFLDDLICGFRFLKNNKTIYNETELQFMLYTCMLFPQHEGEILELFIPVFIKREEEPNARLSTPSYIRMLKSLCCDINRKNSENKNLQIILPYLRKRILEPTNLASFQAICNNLSNNCYQQMGDLQQVFDVFVNLLHKEIIDSKYKLKKQTIKMMISIYQRLLFFDLKIRAYPFFSALPDIFKNDEQCFNNFLEILPDIFSFNFISFVSEIEIIKINQKINKCDKFKSPRTKLLLRNYAQNLVLLHRIDLVTFGKLFDYI